jgi:hypothetical protein
MERERFDGADVLHLMLAMVDDLDWRHLCDRFRGHERVLLAHAILFQYVYPDHASRLPRWLIPTLLDTPDVAMGVAAPYEPSSELQYQHLFAMDWSLITPPRHPLLKRTAITLRDLSHQPLILFERGSTGRQHVVDHVRMRLKPPGLPDPLVPAPGHLGAVSAHVQQLVLEARAPEIGDEYDHGFVGWALAHHWHRPEIRGGPRPTLQRAAATTLRRARRTEAGQQVRVRPRDDVRTNEFTDFGGSFRAGIHSRLHATDVAPREDRNQSAADGNRFDQRYVGRLNHGVAGLHAADVALRFNHA